MFSATMTDGLSELVRVGLRNPVRVVVKVESKKIAGVKRKADQIEERRTPARYDHIFLLPVSANKLQLTELLCPLQGRRQNPATLANIRIRTKNLGE